MANIFQLNGNSFIVIVFVAIIQIIQPKVDKRFHHFYLSCFTVNISQGQESIIGWEVAAHISRLLHKTEAVYCLQNMKIMHTSKVFITFTGYKNHARTPS